MRCLEGFEGAKRFADIQKQVQGLPEDESQSFLTRRMLLNARVAHRLCEHYTERVAAFMPSRAKWPPYLTTSERERFHNSFYTVWITIHLAVADSRHKMCLPPSLAAESLPSFLDQAPLRRLHSWWEVSRWIREEFTAKEFCTATRMSVKHFSGIESEEEMERIWDQAHEEIRLAWKEKSLRITGSSGVYIPEDSPLQYFSIFDKYQEEWVGKIPMEA